MSTETSTLIGRKSVETENEEQYPVLTDHINPVTGEVNRQIAVIGRACTFLDEQGRPGTSIIVYNGVDKRYPENSVMAIKYTYRSGGNYILRPVQLALGDNVRGEIKSVGDDSVLILRQVPQK